MLNVRWLGRVPYEEALDLQRALFRGASDHLLLLEHPPTYTLGIRADRSNVLVEPSSVGASLVSADRGGDVTYHGPGQLVGYPVLSVAGKRGGGMADTVAYVTAVEQLVIDTCASFGLIDVGRLRGKNGVWVAPTSPSPRKLAAVGVRLSRGRSMHGFSLNVDRDVLSMFEHIVPCGIADLGVTSLAAEGIDVSMQQVVDAVTAVARTTPWADAGLSRADVGWRERPEDLSPFSRGAGPGSKALGRLEQAGVETSRALTISERKPEWLRVKANMGPEYRALKKTVADLRLVTVCEEAGCPNIFDCWNAGTATFMVLGERCTRACGFCLVDTSKPLAPDRDEPGRVADAVERMSLRHAVLTMVARDDLPDGGAAHVAQCIRAIRDRSSAARVEVLISDLKGSSASLQTIVDARPDVLNHNLETVARLQRAVRPSAGYARSLALLSRSAANGLVTKSGVMVGLGETADEVREAMVDLRSVGVSILTIGQYLRPTSTHLPVARWWAPEEFDDLRAYGQSLGFSHVEASPLTRSSYHAANGADAVASSSGSSVSVSLSPARR